MKKILSFDGPVLNFIGKLPDVLWLNLLWLIFSIPVFTLGASTSALYYVTLKLSDDRGVSVTKDFFDAFKSNFRQGSVLGIILLITGAVLAADGFIFLKMRFANTIWLFGSGIWLFVVFLYTIALLFVFPLQAHFKNTMANTLKNSLMIAMRYLPATLLIVAIHAIIIILAYTIFAPIILVGEALAAFTSSYVLNAIFKRIGRSDNTDFGQNSD